jgi:hypothetical protein
MVISGKTGPESSSSAAPSGTSQQVLLSYCMNYQSINLFWEIMATTAFTVILLLLLSLSYHYYCYCYYCFYYYYLLLSLLFEIIAIILVVTYKYNNNNNNNNNNNSINNMILIIIINFFIFFLAMYLIFSNMRKKNLNCCCYCFSCYNCCCCCRCCFYCFCLLLLLLLLFLLCFIFSGRMLQQSDFQFLRLESQLERSLVIFFYFASSFSIISVCILMYSGLTISCRALGRRGSIASSGSQRSISTLSDYPRFYFCSSIDG